MPQKYTSNWLLLSLALSLCLSLSASLSVILFFSGHLDLPLSLMPASSRLLALALSSLWYSQEFFMSSPSMSAPMTDYTDAADGLFPDAQ